MGGASEECNTTPLLNRNLELVLIFALWSSLVRESQLGVFIYSLPFAIFFPK